MSRIPHIRFNGVCFWIRDQSLLQRVVYPGNKPLEFAGLAPGIYTLCSFPDDFQFEPETIEVTGEDQ